MEDQKTTEGQPQLLAFAVEAKLKNGAIGRGVIFARTEEAARRDAQTDKQCEALLRSKRLPSHDMFRTTFKPGKVYTPQVFQANADVEPQRERKANG
jgi:hypothetical protein